MATQATPITTLFPTTSCFGSCGFLFDVNGACVPPAVATADANAYGSCFCNDARLKPFLTGTSGVCECTADPAGLATVQSWYTSFCANKAQASGVSSTATSGSTSGSGSKSNSQGGGGSWISNHYQWIIFLIIMIIAIVGIWVGACIWRRKYLAKRDRQYALGKNLARATESGRIVPNESQAGSIHVPGAGMFAPAPITSAGVYDQEKLSKSRQKWNPSSRT